MKARLRRDLVANGDQPPLLYGWNPIEANKECEWRGRSVGWLDDYYTRIDWDKNVFDCIQPDCMDGQEFNIIIWDDLGIYYALSIDFEFGDDEGVFE